MQKKILFGIIIIIAVVVVIFGGVFAYQYFTKPQTTTTNVQTAGPALSEVEGWKTYTSKEYGFEFQYPIYSSGTFEPDANRCYDGTDHGGDCESYVWRSSSGFISIEIIKHAFDEKSLKEVSVQKIIIGEKQGFEYKNNTHHGFIVPVVNNYLNIYEYSSKNSLRINDQDWKKIISTFKFTK